MSAHSPSETLQKSTIFKPGRYLVWLEQANFDLQAARNSYEDGFYEWTCFQSQQSLEKCIKSVLVHAGLRAPRIHKLGILMGMCNQANPNFVNVKVDFRRMESYTFLSRYPFLIPGQNLSPHEFISATNARECIAIAAEAYEIISKFLRESKYVAAQSIQPRYFTKVEVDLRIAQFVDIVKQKYDPVKITMFGSFVRNKELPTEKTMDMLVVAETDQPFIERISSLREAIRGGTPIIEPLVYTPNELANLLDEEGEGFLESALDEGVVVYQK
jgi:HEPN domain-containing protein